MSDKKIVTYAQTNSVDSLQDDPDTMIVSIDLLHEDAEGECNRNECNISHSTIERSKDTIREKPILFRYDSQIAELVTDVTEHAKNDQDVFNTRMAGQIPSDSRMKFIKRENGKTYLNVEAVIHKRYVPQLVEILKNHNGTLKVSIEIVAKGYQDEASGIFVVTEFRLLGVMLLSDTVAEGIENSHLNVLKFSEKEIKEMKQAYMAFSGNNRGNDIFDKIKIEKEIKNMALGIHELEGRLWKALKVHTYHDGAWEGKKYWIIEVLPQSKEVVVHDNEIDEDFKMPYKVSSDGDITVDDTKRVKIVIDKEYREVKNAFVFAKEEYGLGEEIEIDKSKDAMSDTEWGKVNKTDLRNKVLDAKNYKELVKAVYLKVEDGWEDAPSEKLGYPVMEIKGGKAVYNREGLASALGYAKTNDEEEVLDELEDIYEELGLDEEKIDNTKGEVEVKNSGEEGSHNDELETLRREFAELSEKLKCAEEKCAELEMACEEKDKLFRDKETAYEELKKEFEDLNDKYITYKRADDKAKMHGLLKQYRKAFSDNEYEIIASEIEEGKEEVCSSVDNFLKYIESKLMLKAKAMFESTDEETATSERVFSNSEKGVMRNYSTHTTPLTGIDAVCAKYSK